MNPKKFNKIILIQLVIWLLVNCASNTAPLGWIPSPVEYKTNSFGCWTTLKVRKMDQQVNIVTINGETAPATIQEGKIIIFTKLKYSSQKTSSEVGNLKYSMRVEIIQKSGDWLEVVSSDGHSGWIEQKKLQPDKKGFYNGELIAVESDVLYLLTVRSILVLPQSDIEAIKITRYNSMAGYFGLWTFLGVLSTASHGAYLAISAPIWLLVGISTTAIYSHEPEVAYPKVAWSELKKYSRFPQGLPEGMDKNQILPKAVLESKK